MKSWSQVCKTAMQKSNKLIGSRKRPQVRNIEITKNERPKNIAFHADSENVHIEKIIMDAVNMAFRKVAA
jgi:hypothetical protein